MTILMRLKDYFHQHGRAESLFIAGGMMTLFYVIYFVILCLPLNLFYLAISAISNKKMHHSWGHVHNDKLSFDLQVNNIDLVKDPGTFTYSAFPEKRTFTAQNCHGASRTRQVGTRHTLRQDDRSTDSPHALAARSSSSAKYSARARISFPRHS